MFHLKIKYPNGKYKSLGKMQTFNKDKKNLLKLISYFIAILAYKANEYFTETPSALICSYCIKPSNQSNTITNRITKTVIAKNLINNIQKTFYSFYGVNLPNTMDYTRLRDS